MEESVTTKYDTLSQSVKQEIEIYLKEINSKLDVAESITIIIKRLDEYDQAIDDVGHGVHNFRC